MLRNLLIITSMLAPLALCSYVQAAPQEAPAKVEAPVNINTASAAELSQALNGVGVSRAEQIIKLRDEIGGFSAVEQLLDVRGIGPKFIEKNAAKIVL